jgi:proteasome assembly chaperone (PAC2) family protein
VALIRFHDPGDLVAPTLVAALDGWIDAGGASTSAADRLAGSGETIATFDGDVLFDYRARRPTLEIVDGRLTELTWPELSVKRTRIEERDLLVLSGAEPDYRWQELSEAIVELVRRLDVAEWISLGAIPAAVPHTRPVPILGTESARGLLRAQVRPGPDGLLRVPAATLSVLELAVSQAGIPSVGYFGQVPHYVSGPYPAAALALAKTVAQHLAVDVDMADLAEEARQLRTRLDAAASVDETTRQYVERLESMADEERLPAGDDLIADIERFLRERGGGSSGEQRQRLN